MPRLTAADRGSVDRASERPAERHKCHSYEHGVWRLATGVRAAVASSVRADLASGAGLAEAVAGVATIIHCATNPLAPAEDVAALDRLMGAMRPGVSGSSFGRQPQRTRPGRIMLCLAEWGRGMQKAGVWPELDYARWRHTATTLQLWMQIVGKIRLSLTPWLNHGWHVPLYVTARGLGTSPIPTGGEVLEIDFDLVDHRLVCRTSRGGRIEQPLAPMSVGSFYHDLLKALATLDVVVAIDTIPNEVPEPIPFPDDDEPRAYDAGAAHAFWRALLQVDRVFKLFRTGFIGKASPAHFFWGSFDLAVTRFSGRPAPLHPGGVPGLPDRVTREAYSHEVSSAGFWPGSDAFPRPAFYSYAYPEPPGFRDATMPSGAGFNEALGEFVLPYDDVRTADDPDGLLLDFLDATYAAVADAGTWDRAALECALGRPRHPRPLAIS